MRLFDRSRSDVSLPPHIYDLAPSPCHYLATRRSHYHNDNSMINGAEMMQWLIELYPRSMSLSSIGLTSCVGLVALVFASKNFHDRTNFKRFTLPDLDFELVIAEQAIDKPTRTILVTGGNGFLGRYLVSRLLRQGDIAVIVLDVVIPRATERHPKIHYARANLLKLDQLERVFQAFKIDSVFHCASIIPFLGVPDRALWLVNVQGTQNIADTASRHGVKSFIYTSSATVVLSKEDTNSRNLREDSSPYPARHMDKYTEYKEEAEKIVKASSDLKGMVCCSLRPAAIFGRGDKHAADTCLTGINNVLIGYLDMKMDWVSVESVAEGHVLAEVALQDPIKRQLMHGQEYFIGSNEEIAYGEFFGHGDKDKLSHWNQPCAQRIPIWLVDSLAHFNVCCCWLLGFPMLANALSVFAIAYTRRHYTYSSEKAWKHFGYKPLTTTREAIRLLVESYQASRGK